MPRELALAALPRGDVERELEGLRPECFHLHPVVVAPRVHVHLVREQLEPAGGGHELQGRDEGEVRDRAVAGDEQDEVRAGGHLPRDALEIVTGAVHEVVAGRAHGLSVVDDVVETNLGVLLAGGPERLEGDVVEPAEVVAAGRISFRGSTVIRRVALEALDLLEEAAGGRGVAHVLEHIGLGPDELVGLREVRGPAVADDLLGHPAGEGVSGHPGERVGAPALEGEAQGPGRLRSTRGARHLGQPAFDEREAPRHLRLVAAVHALEGVEHVIEGIAARGHEPLQVVARVGPGAIVDREHRPHVGMDHEPREDPQHVVEVVRAGAAAALGVGHGHDAVHPGRRPAGGLPGRVAGEPVRAGGHREHHHEVAGSDPASPGPPVPVERPFRIDRPFDLLARPKGVLVEIVGFDRVGEVRLRGQCEVDVALRERLQYLLVADVFAGGERPGRDPEREPPGEEAGALGDRLADEPMPFEHRVGEPEHPLPVAHFRPRIEAPGRDHDVVPRGGHPCHPVECKALGHSSSPVPNFPLHSCPGESARLRQARPVRSALSRKTISGSVGDGPSPRAISRCDSRWTPRFRRPGLRESEPNYNVKRARWNGRMHESGCAHILESGQREMTLALLHWTTCSTSIGRRTCPDTNLPIDRC